MNKKFAILSISVALLVVATITMTSYAYFTISNKTGEETVIKSGSMTLKLTDGNKITSDNMLPGQSIEKEFSVENTGNVATSYDVYLSEVINNFADKTDLVYEITSTDGGYETSNPTQVQAPSAPAKIVSDYSIGVGVTHHYKIKLTFLNKDENQDDNQGKLFSAKIQGNEYKDIDTNINFYLDNVLVDTMPTNIYSYSTSSCDKDALVSFDDNAWDYDLININQKDTTCNIYFITPTYTLTYDYNYTGSTDTTKSVKMGEPYGTLPNPDRPSYEFIGWFTDSTGGTEVTAETLMGTSDTRIYAHYNGYTVTYHSNGGTGTMADTVSEIVANQFTAPTDMIFDKWNTNQYGSGTTYTVGQEVTSDLDLYAIWKTVPKLITTLSNPWTYGKYYQLSNGDKFITTNTSNLIVMVGSIGADTWETAMTTAQGYNTTLNSRLMTLNEARAMDTQNDYGESQKRANTYYDGVFDNGGGYNGTTYCSSYEYRCSAWWLSDTNGGSGLASYIRPSGQLAYVAGYGGESNSNIYIIRPVITLPNDATYTGGTGTASDPYIISNY